MKALQRKKTGLRSILRWGLVAFSLAALVFAACNTGGGDESYGPSRRVISIHVAKSPDGLSYEGLEVNLEGIEVVLTYADGSSQLVKDPGMFYTESPRASADLPTGGELL